MKDDLESGGNQVLFRFKTLALSSNQEISSVAQEIGLPLGKSTVRQFSDGEIREY